MEKTKLELLTICDYAIVSQDNKLSIIGMFEQIFVANIPSQHPQMFIVGILNGEAGKSDELTLEISTPSGSDAISPQKISVTIGSNGKSNIIAGVGNLPLQETGFYKIKLKSGDRKLGEKEFGVFKNAAEEAAKPSTKYKN